VARSLLALVYSPNRDQGGILDGWALAWAPVKLELQARRPNTNRLGGIVWGLSGCGALRCEITRAAMRAILRDRKWLGKWEVALAVGSERVKNQRRPPTSKYSGPLVPLSGVRLSHT
jgi:hypothetical protein